MDDWIVEQAEIFQDVDATRVMALAPLATDVKWGNAPLVAIVEYKNDAATIAIVREHLAHGTAVLATEWHPQRHVEFSIDEVSLYRPPINQPISWQGGEPYNGLVIHIG